MRRAVLLGLVFVLAACPVSQEAGVLATDDGADSPAPGNGKSACNVSSDCVVAAATCCDCAAFAVNVLDPTHRGCNGVMCPGSRTCPDNVTAACDEGFCVLACAPMACPESNGCAAGYAIDPTGCLSCACAVPEPSGCVVDDDCARTRADCCGCQQGGIDTAVLGSEQAAFDVALGCGSGTSCPQVSVCEPGAVPRCIQGRCELTAAGALPVGACGRADLPGCPANLVCTVNTSDPANLLGVGVCVPR